ncbi:MAG TPA: hypothetical protein VNM48_15925, partial [Chloroflexota bacterium]|nr:hypothetical protein [Chloroflexota bacterium]
MANEEVYKIRSPVDVEDNTAEGLRAPRQRVSAFEREQQRRRREQQRHQHMTQQAQRHELQRQRMTVQFH